jgi:membrane associated rhomboid family serine protease
MNREPAPVNPLPPIVWVLFLAIVGPEIVFQLGEHGLVGDESAIGWRLSVIRDYGFSGSAFDWMVENQRWPSEHLMRFVTYPFVHGALTAVAFSAVMLLALGKLVGETMGQLAVFLLFVCASVVGALVFGLATDEAWLISAFPGVYGLIGGYTYLMWMNLGARGADQKQAFVFISFLMGIQLFFAVFFETGLDWVADLAGFVAGFGLSFIVVPGGWARMVHKMRRRE